MLWSQGGCPPLLWGPGREKRGLCPTAGVGWLEVGAGSKEERAPTMLGAGNMSKRVTVFSWFSFFVHLHHHASGVYQFCSGKGRRRTTTVPTATVVLARVIGKLSKDVVQRLWGALGLP